jgi:hypothetical protein
MKALLLTFFSVVLAYSLFSRSGEAAPKPVFDREVQKPYHDKAPDRHYVDSVLLIEQPLFC